MHSVLGWLSQYGYPALFCLLALGIVGLPVPDETLLMFSGYLILRGRMHPWFAFTAAVAGSSLGISISYLIGRTLGCRFAVRFGKYVHVTEERIDRVNAWFRRIGAWLLTVGYFIPGVRHFTALVAGMSRLPYRTFAAFLTVGYFVGEQWERASATVQHDLLIGTAALGAGVLAWWAVRKIRKRHL
jgi:membrane protein DedA with SNARE-associated domain